MVLVACLLSVVTPRALGSVHPYNGQRFFQKADAWLFRGGREGLFSSTPEAQAHWLHVAKGVANGKAYVRFSHLRVTRPPYEAMLSPLTGETGVVEALLFEVADLGRIGYTSRTGLRYFCCSQELVPRTGCKPGHIIVRPRDGDAPVCLCHPQPPGSISWLAVSALAKPRRGVECGGIKGLQT